MRILSLGRSFALLETPKAFYTAAQSQRRSRATLGDQDTTISTTL